MPGTIVRWARGLAFVAFFTAVLWLGCLGTQITLRFAWPGYGLLGLAGVLGLAWWSDGSVRPSRLLTVSALAFAAYAVVRSLNSPVAYLARGDMAIALGGVVAFALGTGLWARRDRAVVVLGAAGLLLAANLAFALIQIREWPELHPLSALGYARVPDFSKAGGLYESGNHLAGFLEVVGVFFLGYGLFAKPRITGRLLLLFGALVAGVLLAVTASRGGVAGAAVGVVVVVAFGVRATWVRGGVRLWPALGGAAGLALALGLVVYLNRAAIVEEFGSKLFDQSSYRWGMFNMALRQHELEPVWGTGAGTFRYLCRLFIPPEHVFLVKSGLPEPVHAHCDYMELLAEFGWVGLGLAGLAAAAALRAAWGFASGVRRATLAGTGFPGRSQLGAVVGASGVAGAYAVHSLVDFNLQIAANALLFSLAFAGLNRTVPPAPVAGGASSASAAGRLGWWRLLLAGGAVAGLSLVVMAVRFAPAEFSMMRGEIEEHRGNPLAAVPHYREAAERDPESFPARMALGRAYGWLGSDEASEGVARMWRLQSVDAYHRAKLVHPDNTYAHYGLGIALEELGAYESAKEAYVTAIRLAPNHRDIWEAYGACLVYLRDYPGARDAFQRVVDLHLWDSRRPEIWETINELDRLIDAGGG